MEDENGLELSLGLSCGGLPVKSKGKNGSSLDNRAEEDVKGTKIVDDFKSFLNPGTQKQDSSSGSQRNDSVKTQENFFNDLSKSNTEFDASMNLNGRGVWIANSNNSADIEEEKWREVGKRKMLFDEMNHSKKQEREANVDLHDKTRTSHISMTTEDGSTAENEDVAESEVEGSSSKHVSQHDDGPKRFFGVVGSSEVSKDSHGLADSNVVDLNGQKRFNSTSENEFKLGNMAYSVPFAIQSVNMMTVPYSSLHVKESNSVGVPSSSGQLPPAMMQVIPPAGSDRSGAQTGNPGNLPLMFGYSPVQLPTLDKDNSWGLVSQTQQFHPSYAGRGLPNSAEAAQYNGRSLEQVKGDGKQNGPGEGSSSQTEEDAKGSSTNLSAKDASDRLPADALSLNFSAIKPGIAADVKFGGCGSYPNLPWVSTTGTNGRTISGVTYRYSTNEIRIVCACHGSHMSPEEFVRHAGEEHVNPENVTTLTTVPNSNPSASAQS